MTRDETEVTIAIFEEIQYWVKKNNLENVNYVINLTIKNLEEYLGELETKKGIKVTAIT